MEVVEQGAEQGVQCRLLLGGKAGDELGLPAQDLVHEALDDVVARPASDEPWPPRRS
ncbi:MAG: hypothetical protein ACRDPW_09970 [Mycobacteriales bacterium]